MHTPAPRAPRSRPLTAFTTTLCVILGLPLALTLVDRDVSLSADLESEVLGDWNLVSTSPATLGTADFVPRRLEIAAWVPPVDHPARAAFPGGRFGVIRSGDRQVSFATSPDGSRLVFLPAATAGAEQRSPFELFPDQASAPDGLWPSVHNNRLSLLDRLVLSATYGGVGVPLGPPLLRYERALF